MKKESEYTCEKCKGEDYPLLWYEPESLKLCSDCYEEKNRNEY